MFGSIKRQEVLHEKGAVYGEPDCGDFERVRCWAARGDVIRKYGISSASYFKWKAKYGGLDASEVKRIQELEGQLAVFKREYRPILTLRIRR